MGFWRGPDSCQFRNPLVPKTLHNAAEFAAAKFAAPFLLQVSNSSLFLRNTKDIDVYISFHYGQLLVVRQLGRSLRPARDVLAIHSHGHGLHGLAMLPPRHGLTRLLLQEYGSDWAKGASAPDVRDLAVADATPGASAPVG